MKFSANPGPIAIVGFQIVVFTAIAAIVLTAVGLCCLIVFETANEVRTKRRKKRA